ncbi:CDF family Co(II)/Ni(II) efflux transporter DmeF [Catenovulum adriaticum]|uniref:CDF family Co(II)/Ni(II) efflux transporter DmeF n=1 Tax=Catenovulum adriaticum TaxID=2984846 RepID=A0ABY7APU7_9ALTE|nr:CDF family Co(II)/Ni(II) efflux transporter DmeF [Catenovulum sp. TS8]WAJ71529.1 CDF family Co(II)/Ni(II) efflux transporter DmeF [Catenovulum sp. TS8]
MTIPSDHKHSIKPQQHNNEPLLGAHQHNYFADKSAQTRKVYAVLALTLATMFAEISVGIWSGSMALLADGWHMGTHAAAFSITLFTYWYANKHKNNESFSFGTGKVTALGGFASAVGLAIVALLMVVESVERLLNPHQIYFNEAIGVAIIGLLVNVASVFILHDNHDHSHDHNHGHHDHNIKAAYYHVLADALTSLLAIAALLAGKYFNWIWMDALMGIVGAVIIVKWAWGLIIQTSETLLDKSVELTLNEQIKQNLESEFNVTVSDFHIWRLADKHNALIAAVVVDKQNIKLTPEQIKTYLYKHIDKLSHATIEINHV